MFKTSEEFLHAIATSLIKNPSVKRDQECNPLFSWGRFFYREHLECEEAADEGLGANLSLEDHFKMSITEEAALVAFCGEKDKALESLCKLFGVTPKDIAEANARFLGSPIVNVRKDDPMLAK